MKKKKQTQPTLQLGDRVIYADGKSMMDVLTVKNITEKGYTLSNGMQINFKFQRIDRKVQSLEEFMECTEDNLLLYRTFTLTKSLTKLGEEVSASVSKINRFNISEEDQKRLLKIEKYLNKLKELL